jgi:ankyrin repeat protein
MMNNRGRERVDGYLEKYEFLAYATVFWDEHARTVLTDRSIFRRVRHFFRPAKNRTFAFWKHLRRYIIRNSSNELSFRLFRGCKSKYSVIQKTSPLHWAAILALPTVCKWPLKQNLDINEVSVFGRPLSCALLDGTEVDEGREWSLEGYPIWRGDEPKTVIDLFIARGAILDEAPFSIDIWTPLGTALFRQLYDITELLANAGGKLAFKELQVALECQLECDEPWMPLLPSTPIELSKFIVPEESIEAEENVFRLGILLTVPFVNNEYSYILDDEFWSESESNDGTDSVPKCLDVEYKGPISPSTWTLLYDTIRVHAELNSFNTFTALVGLLGVAKESADEQNSVLQKQFASFLKYDIRENLQVDGRPASRMLTILEALEVSTTIPIVDDEGNTLMHIVLDIRAPPEIIDTIFRLGINSVLTNDAGETLIHLAASKGNLVVLQRLIRNYDCISILGIITENGSCPLFLRSAFGLGRNDRIYTETVFGSRRACD